MENNPVMQQMPETESHQYNQRPPAFSKSRQLYKSPLLAGLLSILPGLGQIYLGYYKHGFIFIAGFLSLTLVASSMLEPVLPVFVFACMFVYFFIIIDAVRRAKLYNQVVDGVSQAELPTGFDIPSVKGSIGLGATLVLGGFIMFLHTMFGMSLSWIADWWPAGIIGFGAYLIIKELKERAEKELDKQ